MTEKWQRGQLHALYEAEDEVEIFGLEATLASKT